MDWQLGETQGSRALTAQLAAMGIDNPQVLQIMRQIPRPAFVDEALRHQAWDNNALPIGQGQTLSQPYIVARMTSLLAEVAPQKVLEIGTGSGYQSTALSLMFSQVYSIERIRSLQLLAKRHFHRWTLTNLHTRVGDGWQGWPSAAPFDAIIVTAAAPRVPQALLEQLADGGRLIIPVGEQGTQQRLLMIDRQGEQLITQDIEAVRFVPLVEGL